MLPGLLLVLALLLGPGFQGQMGLQVLLGPEGILRIGGEQGDPPLLLLQPTPRYLCSRWGRGTILPKMRAKIILWGGTMGTLHLTTRRRTGTGIPVHLRPVLEGGERG